MTDKFEPVAVSLAVLLALSVTLGGLVTFSAWSNNVSIPKGLVWVGDTSYDSDNVSVAPPPFCHNLMASPGNRTTFSFQGVSFTLWISASCSPGGALLNGTVSEANGTGFHLAIAGLSGPTPYLTWISPDHYCGVEWDRYLTVILLVRT